MIIRRTIALLILLPLALSVSLSNPLQAAAAGAALSGRKLRIACFSDSPKCVKRVMDLFSNKKSLVESDKLIPGIEATLGKFEIYDQSCENPDAVFLLAQAPSLRLKSALSDVYEFKNLIRLAIEKANDKNIPFVLMYLYSANIGQEQNKSAVCSSLLELCEENGLKVRPVRYNVIVVPYSSTSELPFFQQANATLKLCYQNIVNKGWEAVESNLQDFLEALSSDILPSAAEAAAAVDEDADTTPRDEAEARALFDEMLKTSKVRNKLAELLAGLKVLRSNIE